MPQRTAPASPAEGAGAAADAPPTTEASGSIRPEVLGVAQCIDCESRSRYTDGRINIFTQMSYRGHVLFYIPVIGVTDKMKGVNRGVVTGA